MEKEQVEAYMNLVSERIREAEVHLKHIWFDIDEEPIAWALNDVQNPPVRRIMLGDKPLLDHKFEFREKYIKHVRSLVIQANDLAGDRMDAFGNMDGFGNEDE